MVIALIICIPVSFILGVVVALKGVQIGLRWKIEIEKKETPTMSSPVAPIVNAIKKKIDRSVVTKKEEEEESIMNDYFGSDDDPLNQKKL